MSGAYARAVATIDAVEWRGIMPGLERTRALLAALGNPHVGMRGALVAGTNGKGSVCATVDAVCCAAGVRTVLLTKPHLRSYCERIVRDGVAIGEAEFGELVAAVAESARPLPEELQPTGFELLTAAGIVAAADAHADVVICEVGLGGRLDSTNVLDLGIAVVTNVALDHQEFLGETIAEIAREKAAIIKAGNLAVTAATGTALDVIRARVREVGAQLVDAGDASGIHGRSRGMAGVEVRVMYDGRELVVRAPLLGAFQEDNVRTAVAVCDALRSTGTAIPWEAVLRGCTEVRWPGRMQWLDTRPAVLIDGAHNPAGMAAMVAAAAELVGDRRVVAVFAAMRNKDVAGMAALLNGLTNDVVVTAPEVERSAPATEVARHFIPHASVVDGVANALDEARTRAGDDGVVVVCGSLYLAGETLTALGI